MHVSPHVPWLQYLRTALHRCHRHTATPLPTTALLSAVVPHHSTTTQVHCPGGGGEEGKKYRYSICNYNYTLCHVSFHNITYIYLPKYPTILQLHETYKWYTKMSMEKRNTLVGFYKGTFFKTLSHFSFFVSCVQQTKRMQECRQKLNNMRSPCL